MKLIVPSLTALAIALPTFAADLIVEESGVSPLYGTIQDAVNAASAGDRIFVKNKSGNVPYTENVTIDKPIELLPYADNGQFIVFGNYTITPNGLNFSAVNNSVRIIGMLNQSGSVSATANNTTGNAIEISVLGSQLNSGSITITGTELVSRVSGNWLQSGSVTVREATVAGNLINGDINVNDAGGSNHLGDTLYIIGNRLATNVGGVAAGNIAWNNNDHYCHIANNFVRSNVTGGLIYVGSVLTGSGDNLIVNNSLETDSPAANPGIEIAASVPVGCRLKIENNGLHDGHSGEGGNEFALDFSGGVAAGALVEANYNVQEGFEDGLANVAPATVPQTGNVNAPATWDASNVTGEYTTAEAVNAGNPAGEYTDHDLSRNDVGVAGGSYNYNNFWPILTGGARVFIVKTPRLATPSSTISAEAEGFDR